MDFLQVDVFAEEPYGGNPLAVFPAAGELSASQMQKIAREMNLSETTFVAATRRDSYDVRIFTPDEEMQFAGHPTLGTAWVLRHLELVSADEVKQHSRVGQTAVRFEGDRVWLDRTGTVEPDYEDAHPSINRELARDLGLDEKEIGLEARELGRNGMLRPALATAGLLMMLVPVRDIRSLEGISPTGSASIGGAVGFYCFTAHGAGQIRSRGFFPGLGISEDPGTGSAAAALGLYLADRIGSITLEIDQGVEMEKPCRMKVRADEESVTVGGHVRLVLTGRLEELP